MIAERTQEMTLALDKARVAAADDRAFVYVTAREIDERLRLEAAPNVLDRSQLGRLRWDIETT